jgi:hypothetical protein
MRDHFTPIKMPAVKNQKITSVSENVDKSGPLCTIGCMKDNIKIPQSKMELTVAILLLDILKELKAESERDTFMFIAELFTAV